MLRALLAAALLAAPLAAAEKPKNIIVMIADGAGYNMLAATRYWKGAPLTADGADWQRAAMATYTLRGAAEGEGQDSHWVYDSEKAWDTRPVPGDAECAERYPAGFAAYEWLRCSYPDSAGTMSAMMTGVRTYNGAINIDGGGEAVLSAAEVAKAAGKTVGTVSSVPFTHATPAAGGGAHNRARGNYHEIGAEMLSADTLDFIAGAGSPDFDFDGRPVAPDADPEELYAFISPESWDALTSGSSGWTLVRKRAEIQTLALTPRDGRVIVVPEAGGTLHTRRAIPEGVDPMTVKPFVTPLNENVATLTELTAAALAHAKRDVDGFFLTVEGGAVDWAMHGNALFRAIEEYDDFDRSVRLVSDTLDDPASGMSWDDTLVIVTADHDHMLFGPDEAVPFQPVQYRGAGNLPGHKWWSGSHSNQLVPFFVRGAGADAFIARADEVDSVISPDGQRRGHGRYLTQPEMGQTLIDLLSE